MAELLAQFFIEENLTVSTAESCTSGLLASEFTNVKGASRYFSGGVVAYTNTTKIDHLQVDHEILENFGAVSEQCALSMVIGAQKKFQTDISISVTGDLEDPYIVFYAIRFGSNTKVYTLNISAEQHSSRSRKKDYIVNHILNSLFQFIRD